MADPFAAAWDTPAEPSEEPADTWDGAADLSAGGSDGPTPAAAPASGGSTSLKDLDLDALLAGNGLGDELPDLSGGKDLSAGEDFTPADALSFDDLGADDLGAQAHDAEALDAEAGFDLGGSSGAELDNDYGRILETMGHTPPDDNEEFFYDDNAIDLDPGMTGLASTTAADIDAFDTSAEADEFALGDFGSQFGLSEKDFNEDDLSNPAQHIEAEIAAAQRSLSLSDEEFAQLQRNLARYPLNLKIAVEELIGEKEVPPEELQSLVRHLVQGQAARPLASQVSRLLGKTIRIPPGYEKSTGEAFVARERSLWYNAQRIMVPILSAFAALTVLTALVILLGFNFIYKPLAAQSLYQQGYELIPRGDRSAHEDLFRQAVDLWWMDDWFFRYAEALAGAGQFDLAERKYRQLLRPARSLLAGETGEGREVFTNFNRKALLDWARLKAEFGSGGNLTDPGPAGRTLPFEEAETLVNLVLERDMYDREGLLVKGDVNLLWAREDNTRLAAANQAWSIYMTRYGTDGAVLYRFLDLFLLTRNDGEILKIRSRILDEPHLGVRPSVLARLAHYLMDRLAEEDARRRDQSPRRLTLEEELNPPAPADPPWVRPETAFGERLPELLFRALEAAPQAPEIHATLARLYRERGNTLEEEKALGAAEILFQELSAFEARREDRPRLRVDNLIRIGEVFRERREPLQAQTYLSQAQQLYENLIDTGALSPSPALARVYRHLGDLFFEESGHWEEALTLYGRARAQGDAPSAMLYRMAVIHYRENRFSQALNLLYDLEDRPELKGNVSLLYATANSLFLSDNYFGALGYYRLLQDEILGTGLFPRVLSIMEETRSSAERQARLARGDNMSLAEVLGEASVDDREALAFGTRLWNNMAVSMLLGPAARRTDSPSFVEASGLLTRAAVVADALGRRFEDLSRGREDLIALNVRSLVSDYDPENLRIYADLPLNLRDRLY